MRAHTRSVFGARGTQPWSSQWHPTPRCFSMVSVNMPVARTESASLWHGSAASFWSWPPTDGMAHMGQLDPPASSHANAGFVAAPDPCREGRPVRAPRQRRFGSFDVVAPHRSGETGFPTSLREDVKRTVVSIWVILPGPEMADRLSCQA